MRPRDLSDYEGTAPEGTIRRETGPKGAGGPGLHRSESRRDHLAVVATATAFVALFVATTMLSGWHHRRLDRLALESFAQGEAALLAGRAPEAVEAFETSLAHSREDPARQLRLAEALIAAGRDDRARSHLLTLWARGPGSGVVNLHLARLASRHGRVEEAQRHYLQSIHGSWETADPVAKRRQVRLELVRLLVGRRLVAQAQSQLLALAPEVPREPAAQTLLGRLFLGAGEERRALEAFRVALTLAPSHTEALAGAGEAAFRLGEYWNARRHLQKAVRAGGSAEAARLLDLTELVLSLDPFLPRLSSAERARRVVRAWEAATARVEACASRPAPAADRPAAGAETLERLRAALEEGRPRVTVPLLARDLELVEGAMDRVLEVEKDATVVCGPPEGADLALQLVAAARERREQ